MLVPKLLRLVCKILLDSDPFVLSMFSLLAAIAGVAHPLAPVAWTCRLAPVAWFLVSFQLRHTAAEHLIVIFISSSNKTSGGYPHHPGGVLLNAPHTGHRVLSSRLKPGVWSGLAGTKQTV